MIHLRWNHASGINIGIDHEYCGKLAKRMTSRSGYNTGKSMDRYESHDLWVPDERLLDAYKKCLWTLNDPKYAIEAVSSAAARRRTAAASMLDRERKRGDGRVNKVILRGDSLFHYLLLLDTEREEMAQERNGYRLTSDDLTRRFVKHPILFGMNHNSFYAAVGMCVGLCCFRARQVVRLYQAVDPNTNGGKGDRECSRAKQYLAESMLKRFSRIAVSELSGRHIRFRREEPSAYLLDVMKEGLVRFSPSTVGHVIPPDFTLGTEICFPEDLDDAELQLIHAFFDLECYDQLARALNVPSFEASARTLMLRTERLDPECDYGSGSLQSPIEAIRARIDDKLSLIHEVSPHAFQIRVDGCDNGVLLRDGRALHLELTENANVIEVLGQAGDSEAIVGTYVLTYDGPKTECWEVDLPTQGDRILATFEYSDACHVSACFKRERQFRIFPLTSSGYFGGDPGSHASGPETDAKGYAIISHLSSGEQIHAQCVWPSS